MTGAMHQHLSLPRHLTAISPTAEAVTALMSGWADEARESVDLALVEVLTNILRHGPATATQPVELGVTVEEDAVTIEVIDLVPPIPPGLLASIDPSVLETEAGDLDAIPESGRGLALVLVLMDEVTLLDGDGTARLRLVLRR